MVHFQKEVLNSQLTKKAKKLSNWPQTLKEVYPAWDFSFNYIAGYRPGACAHFLVAGKVFIYNTLELRRLLSGALSKDGRRDYYLNGAPAAPCFPQAIICLQLAEVHGQATHLMR